MSNCCGGSCGSGGGMNPRQADYRRVLRMAFFVNALMFVIELAAGLDTRSLALQADSLNFLRDGLNYGVSLWALGKPLEWRGRASLLKGLVLGGMGLWVLCWALWSGWGWSDWIGSVPDAPLPDAPVMSLVGLAALGATVSVAALLFAGRRGRPGLRAVWLCARRGALGNLAVMAAAAGVWTLGRGWPDLLVAAAIALLSLGSAWTSLRQAMAELRSERTLGLARPDGTVSAGPR